MVTGNDLICGALRVICSLTPGETVPGPEAANALVVLNRMLASWSAKSLMIPFRTLESFPLIVGRVSYTIGAGGDFNTPRPDYLTAAYTRDSNSNDVELTIVPKEIYNGLNWKTLTGVPSRLYYDTQFPRGVIYLDEAAGTALTLFIESLKPVAQFTTLQTAMNLPGEYEEAIVYLLSQRLAPEYGFSISANPDIAQLILEADRFIKRKNLKMKVADFDPAIGCGSAVNNIYTG